MTEGAKVSSAAFCKSFFNHLACHQVGGSRLVQVAMGRLSRL
jgi:hypothetical protein